MGTLVVAFVGDPCTWSKVDYEPAEVPAKECKWLSGRTRLGDEARSATTLKPLLAGGAHAVVYVPVSVAFGIARHCGRIRPRNDCCWGVDEVAECSVEKLDSYNAMEQCVRRRLEEFLKCELGKSGGFEVLVAPSTGRYKRSDGRAVGEFRGDTGLYYAYVLATLCSRLLKHKPDTLVVDTTHGINYVTSIGLQAALRAAEAYSAAAGDNLRVVVVNSEPVYNGAEDPVAIYTTMCRVVQPCQALWSLASLQPPGRLYARLKAEPSSELREEAGRMVEAARHVYTIARALAAGLPLLGLHLYKQHIGKLDELENALKLIENLVSSSPQLRRANSGVFEVVHSYTMESSEVDALVAAHALYRALEQLLSEAANKGEALGDTVFYRLSSLDELVERLRRNQLITTQSYYIAKNEISDMRVRLRAYDHVIGMALRKPAPYTVVYAVADGDIKVAFQKSEPRCNVNERVFYAHAGMARDLVYVAKLDDDYALAYTSKCIKEIEEKIVKKLRAKKGY